jgi:Fe-S-cluster containining protein
MEELLKDNFPCFRCGVCCRKYQVRITNPEAQMIAGQLGMELADFLSKFTDPRWPGQASFLLIHQNESCVFLKTETDGKLTGCSIHLFRPDDCRAWTPGIDRPECRRGLEYWGLTVNNDEISGSKEAVEKFEVFLKSLE